MIQLSITVRVHETDRPIAGLVVTWYATRDDLLSPELSNAAGWDRARLRPPTEHGLTVLGTATTNVEGIARLELRDANDSGQITNVWYTVRPADVAGKQDCGRTIHTACELRRLATNHERFEVRIPRALLDRAGYGRRSSPTIDDVRAIDEFDSALGAAGSVQTNNPTHAPVFARALSERIGKAQRELSKAPRNQAGRVPVTMLHVRSASGSGEPELAFDAANGSVVVRNPATQMDVPLSFEGVTRYRSPGLTESQIERPHLVIDEMTGRINLALPVVPDDLVAREQVPSKLFRQLTRQDRKAGSGDDDR